MIRRLTSIMMLFTLCSCASSYKSTWDCPKVRGIGCSSVEYADYVAGEQIVLNKMQRQEPKQQDDLCMKDCGEPE